MFYYVNPFTFLAKSFQNTCGGVANFEHISFPVLFFLLFSSLFLNLNTKLPTESGFTLLNEIYAIHSSRMRIIFTWTFVICLEKLISCRPQSIDVQNTSTDWF